MDNAAILLRIRELITEKGLSDGKFADLIGVDRSGFSKRMSGQIMSGTGFINRIVLELGVSKRWLIDGVGDRYVQRESKENGNDSELVSSLRDEISRLSHALLSKMNELSEVRDLLHKYELDELRGKITESEAKSKEAKAG